MVKKILIASLLLCLKLNVHSQTLATDFNINDCSGTPHHLFSELDSGKIVVLCFVMPCVGCISPAMATHNVVNSFRLSHPNKVVMYMVDDDGDNDCSFLSGWESTNFLWSVLKFSDVAVVQGQYGVPGMPKMVVLGGAGHYVYDMQNNVLDSVQMTNAINDAIAGVVPAPIPNAVRQKLNIRQVSLSPNPAKDHLALTCHLVSAADVRMDIFDVAGNYVQTVINENQPAGHHSFTVATDGLASGNYLLKLQAGDAQQVLKFTIKK